jgi:glycosyltransferase involved in cell wall biosynthesis
MERKFSVIIPTLHRCDDVLSLLLLNLYNDPAVSEIIIIDNKGVDNFRDLPKNSKLIVYPTEENLYVNPSWNLGVSLSKEDYIAIINDDITIPEGIFTAISEIPLENVGILGAHHPSIQQLEKPQRFTINEFVLTNLPIRTWGYGVLMVMAKKNYFIIPEEMLVWCGDDYLFHKNRVADRNNGAFVFPVQTKMSMTSDDKMFDKIKENDIKIYEQKYKI